MLKRLICWGPASGADVLFLNQLPVGQVAFSASTYDSACAAVTASSVATWLSSAWRY